MLDTFAEGDSARTNQRVRDGSSSASIPPSGINPPNSIASSILLSARRIPTSILSSIIKVPAFNGSRVQVPACRRAAYLAPATTACALLQISSSQEHSPPAARHFACHEIQFLRTGAGVTHHVTCLMKWFTSTTNERAERMFVCLLFDFSEFHEKCTFRRGTLRRESYRQVMRLPVLVNCHGLPRRGRRAKRFPLPADRCFGVISLKSGIDGSCGFPDCANIVGMVEVGSGSDDGIGGRLEG